MKKLFLAAVTFTLITACAHFKPTPGGPACLVSVGEAAANDAIAKIYTIIDNGTAAGDSEAEILAALKDAGIGYAPAVWQCAMLFVGNPDSATDAGVSTKSLGPKTASKSAAAAIANDYLSGGAQ